eukprot:TRINITY_DN64287_c0_g1_i1.p2 TRINITY_DN64287_c0_g1~~TRINITY_DN64287_c0_g1_i1.p2  ORF type:complete len:137 (+),score=10.36 TRINITY_DN64287_c0_g1_i1:185-595(+)
MIKNQPVLIPNTPKCDHLDPHVNQKQSQTNGFQIFKSIIGRIFNFFITSSGELADSSLAVALKELLDDLQPRDSKSSYLSALKIQQQLQDKSSMLEWGYHNDVAEALAVLCHGHITEEPTSTITTLYLQEEYHFVP